ncbi:hypothetical protein F5880DRAFT_1332162 [Lentinula raphanica]|nr:hypothetical protein F5880DRAFT_1332162 [Lentinula raphanica]
MNFPSFNIPTRTLRIVLVVQWVLIVFLTAFNVFRHRLYEEFSPLRPNHIMSPADDIFHYEVQELTFQHVTPYKGAGDEVDQAWAELYNFSKSVLTKDEASLLSNQPDPLYPTSAFKSHGHHSRAASASAHVEPVYLVELDVFSQLHCLDDIRRFVHSNEYPSQQPSSARLSWCIDSLRQSLMCTTDINSMVYSRNPDTKEFELSDTNAYTCRDFGAIREWAKERQLDAGVEMTLDVDDTKYW